MATPFSFGALPYAEEAIHENFLMEKEQKRNVVDAHHGNLGVEDSTEDPALRWGAPRDGYEKRVDYPSYRRIRGEEGIVYTSSAASIPSPSAGCSPSTTPMRWREGAVPTSTRCASGPPAQFFLLSPSGASLPYLSSLPFPSSRLRRKGKDDGVPNLTDVFCQNDPNQEGYWRRPGDEEGCRLVTRIRGREKKSGDDSSCDISLAHHLDPFVSPYVPITRSSERSLLEKISPLESSMWYPSPYHGEEPVQGDARQTTLLKRAMAPSQHGPLLRPPPCSSLRLPSSQRFLPLLYPPPEAAEGVPRSSSYAAHRYPKDGDDGKEYDEEYYTRTSDLSDSSDTGYQSLPHPYYTYSFSPSFSFSSVPAALPFFHPEHKVKYEIMKRREIAMKMGEEEEDETGRQENNDEENAEDFRAARTTSDAALLDSDEVLSHSTYLRSGARSAVSLPMFHSHSLLRQGRGKEDDDGNINDVQRTASRSLPSPIHRSSRSCYRSHSSVAATRVQQLLGSACREVSFPPSASLPSVASLPPPYAALGTAKENRGRAVSEVLKAGKEGVGGVPTSPPWGPRQMAYAPPLASPSSSSPQCQGRHAPSLSFSSFVPDYRRQSYCVASVLHSGPKSREIGVALCHFPSMCFTLTQFSDGMSYNKLLSFLSAKDPVEVILPLSSSSSSSSSTHFMATLLQHLSDDTTCTGVPRSLFHSERGVQLIMDLQSFPASSWSASSLATEGAVKLPFFSSSSFVDSVGGANGGGATSSVYRLSSSTTAHSHGEERNTISETHQCSSTTVTGMRLTSQFLEQEASDRYLCVAAAHALIRYLESLYDCRWRPHSLSIRYEELEQYMEISRATARALHLIPPSYAAEVASSSSFSVAAPRKKPSLSASSLVGLHSLSSSTTLTLMDVLPRTCTMMGQRYLRCAILQPLRGKTAIECRQDVVEWLLQSPHRLLALRQCLRGGEEGGGLGQIDLERLCAELLVSGPVVERETRNGGVTGAALAGEPQTESEGKDGKVTPTPSTSSSFSRSFVLSALDYHFNKVQQLHDYWDILKGCEALYHILGYLLGFLDEDGEEREEEDDPQEKQEGRFPTSLRDQWNDDETARDENNKKCCAPSSTPLPPPIHTTTFHHNKNTSGSSTAEKPLLLHHIFYTLQACHVSSLLEVLRKYLDEAILVSHSTAPPSTAYSKAFRGWRGEGGGPVRRRGTRGVMFKGSGNAGYGARKPLTRTMSSSSYAYRGGKGNGWAPPRLATLSSWNKGLHGRTGGEREEVSRTTPPRDGMKATIFRMLRLSFMVRATPLPPLQTTAADSIKVEPSLTLPVYRQRLSQVLGKISQYTEALQQQYGLTTLRLESDSTWSTWRQRGVLHRPPDGDKTHPMEMGTRRRYTTQRLYRFSFCTRELHKVRKIPFTFMYGVGRSHVTTALDMWRQIRAAPPPSPLPSSSSDTSDASSFSSSEDKGEEEEQEGKRSRRVHPTATGESTPAPSTKTKKTNPSVRIRCSTKELDTLCEEAQECLAYIVAEEVRVTAPLLECLQHHLGRLQAIGESIALLDTLMSFAMYSATQQGQRPVLLDPSSSSTLPRVSFYESRYPSMTLGSPSAFYQGVEIEQEENMANSRTGSSHRSCEREEKHVTRGAQRSIGSPSPPSHPKGSCPAAFPVPNTITWEEGVPLLIVTGPNMSGKTTLLRQVGQLQVLAQCGCFLPVGIPDGDPGSVFPLRQRSPSPWIVSDVSHPVGTSTTILHKGNSNKEGEPQDEVDTTKSVKKGNPGREEQEGKNHPFSSPPLASTPLEKEQEAPHPLRGRTQVSLVHRLMAHLLCDDLPSATLSTFKKELLLLAEMTEAIALDCAVPEEDGRNTAGTTVMGCARKTGKARSPVRHISHQCPEKNAEKEGRTTEKRNTKEIADMQMFHDKEGTEEGLHPTHPPSSVPCSSPASCSSSCCRSSSLLLIDELGRSTNTREGFALAWAFGRFVCELPVTFSSTSLTRATTLPPRTGVPPGHTEEGQQTSTGVVSSCDVCPPPIRVLLTTHFEGLPGLCHLYPHAARHHHFAFTTTTTTPTSSGGGPRRTVFTTSHRLVSRPCPSAHGSHYGLALAKRLQLLPAVVDGAYHLSEMEDAAAAAVAAEDGPEDESN